MCGGSYTNAVHSSYPDSIFAKGQPGTPGGCTELTNYAGPLTILGKRAG